MLKLSDFAEKIRNLVGGNSKLTYSDAVEDDPQRRRPDISVARKQLNWHPKVCNMKVL